MNKHLLATLLIFVSLVTARDLPVVAVMNFDESGMSKTDAANITARFGFELSRANRFTIIEREKMEAILDEQGFQQSGCTASECIVEAGQLLNVEYMVAGKVTKTFDLYSLHVRLISVETGIVVAQVVEDHTGSAADFLTGSVRNAAMKLAAEANVSSSAGTGKTITTISSTGQVNFTLNTSPVNVFIDGTYSGENNSQSVNLSLPMGDHTIKFTASGFQDYEKMITIIKDQKIDYTVEMQRGASGTTSAITTGIIVIRSNPEGATVYLDGRNVGATPFQVPKAGVGKHTVRVEKSLYHDYLEEITLQPDGIAQIVAQLKPAFGSLEIITVPDGGVVTLNGQLKGRTPLILNELASGEYEIVITKDLYHAHRERFIITDESMNKRNISLSPAFGKLAVSGTPAGATVYIDGQLQGKTPLDIDELPSGKYSMRIDMDLYASCESEISIEDGKTNEQRYIMKPRFGTLNINGYPNGANVTINGIKIGQLPLKLYKVSAGLAEIKMEAPQYHPETRFQQINAGDLIDLDINLERHTGSVVVLTDPPGANVRLNLKDYGPSPQIIKDVPTGQQKLQITHPDYLTVDRKFELALNERKEINIPLLTYVGSIQQEIDGVKRIRNLNALAAGALGVTAGIVKIVSISAYHNYENATETNKALDYYDTANSLNKISGYVGIAAGATAIPVFKWQFDIRNLSQKLK